MIEPTDEMVQLIYERIDFWDHGSDGIREGLAAVLAIVERDYWLRRKSFFMAHPHEFVRSDDPKFGAAFGGGCDAEVEGRACGFPEPFHRAWPTP